MIVALLFALKKAIGCRCNMAVVLTLGVLAAPVPIAAGESSIEIDQAWVRATPKGANIAAGYFTVTNRSSAPDRIVSVATALAGRVEMHSMMETNGIMQMRPMEGGLPIPAGGTVSFSPGGNHLMFFGLSEPFAEGAQVPLTISFEKAGRIDVALNVAAAGASGPPEKAQTRPGSRSSKQAEPFFTHFCGARLMANVTIARVDPHSAEVRVQLEDTQENPLSARSVSIGLSDIAQGGPARVGAAPIAADTWRALVDVSAPSNQTLTLVVEFGGNDTVELAGPVILE